MNVTPSNFYIDPADENDISPEASLCYKAALRWHAKGYNVVPRKAGDKHPAVKWTDLQARRVDRNEMLDHFGRYAGGVGFITGAVSGVIVIESDGPEGEAILAEYEKAHSLLPKTLTIKSGSGRGLHRHFRHPGYYVTSSANVEIKLDIKGDKGFCVLPPTLHASGGRYETVIDVEPAELPDGLLQFIASKAAEAEGLKASDHNMIVDGKSDGKKPFENIISNLTGPDFACPNVDEMRSILARLDFRRFFEHRTGIAKDNNGRIVKVGWIEAGMGLKAAYGDEVGFELWSIVHDDDRARADAPAQWHSFASDAGPGHVTVGTIIKAARDAGVVSKPSASITALALTNDNQNLSQNVVADLDFTGEGGDLYNGATFAKLYHGKLLFIYETGDVLTFDQEGGWLVAAPGTAERAAKAVACILKESASNKAQLHHVARLCDLKAQRAMIELAKSEAGMTRRLSDFDNEPMLLGVRNGVLDLRSCKLRAVSPDLLVSKRSNVAFDATAECPRFEQFLKEVQPNVSARAFLQRFVGYCLTGAVSEQVFAFFYGSGFNGKSVFIELLAWLLGDYASRISTEMLMQHKRNPQGASPDILALRGVRLAFANETSEGARLDESLLKQLTGGDTLKARALYAREFVSFAPTHKLVIVGNHRPEIGDTTLGMWRRVLLTPWETTIDPGKRDPDLLARLKCEGSGILNWALEGLREWRNGGLEVPEEIRAATAEYREEQDIIGEWIVENCKTGPGCSEAKGELYLDYELWAKANGHAPLAQKRLTRRLGSRGFPLSPDRRRLHGIALTMRRNL